MASSAVTWTDCECLTEIFKVVDNHEIKVDIVLPPKLKTGKHSVIVAFHGGYLISGARDHYMFMASWLPAYAASTSAIIVSPDYRLFPSATTADILSDVEDLWSWVHTTLPSIVSSRTLGHEVDLTRILVEGNSAGGFCAAHLAINHLESIRAAIMVYPMLDCLASDFTQLPDASASIPFQGDILDARIQAARQEGWVSERRNPDDFLLTRSIMKTDKFREIFGTDKQHNPLDRVRQLQGVKLPRIWILQGKDDTGVPPDGAIAFAHQIGKGAASEESKLDIVDGEPSEHGFDRTWTLEDEKLTKRLDWINEVWLK